MHSLGAVPKKNGKLRPIVDMKRPLHKSVNMFMDSVVEPFHYTTVGKTVRPNMHFAVVDISSAYRSVNVFPGHCEFQGIMWPSSTGDHSFMWTIVWHLGLDLAHIYFKCYQILWYDV